MDNKKQASIVVDQAVLGGIADSAYMGKPNSLASIVGFNLHKVPGLMLVNQKLSQHSPLEGAAAVDDLVKILHCSDGKARLFGKNSGKIWEIDTNGVYTQPAVIPLISDPQYPLTTTNDTSIGDTAGAIMDISLNAGGSGYTAGDILTIAGGTGGTLTVLTVDGSGVVLTMQLTDNGSGYSTGTAVATSYGGVGTGAKVDILTVNSMDWINPGFSQVEDGIAASFRTGNGKQSHYLKATGFGFNIPNGAVIKGIIVEIKEHRIIDGNPPTSWEVQGGSVKLVKGGTITGNDNGATAVGTDPTVYNSIGSPSDLWGLSLTVSDINSATFGVAISRKGFYAIENIDAIRIRVCYTLNGKGAPVLDAREYPGPGGEQYVYYALANFLGRYKVGDPATTRLDNYAEFKNGDKVAHPMKEQNLVLFIGDGNVVAQVDASGENNIPFSPTTFSPIACRIKADERVNCLGNQTTNLLIGSKNVNDLNLCYVYNWDTFSPSFNQADPVPENGINAFMPDKIRVIISVGENGNFYEYVHSFYGMYLQPLEQIPPNFPKLFSNTDKGIIHPGAVDTLQNIPIFGFSRIIGNPTLQGIFTLGGRDSTYPVILTLEYPVSTQSLQNLTIWSLEVVGNDIYVSYMDETDPMNTVYRVDKLDWTKKATTVYFETMIIRYTKTLMDRFKDFVVGYDSLPANTSIDFYYNINKQGYVKFNTVDDPSEFVADTDRNLYKATKTIQGRTVQFKVVVNSNNNDAPNIEDMSALMG